MITYGIGTYAGVMVVITGDISQVPAAVQSGLTAQGYTSARAPNLDVLPNVALETTAQDAKKNAALAAALSA